MKIKANGSPCGFWCERRCDGCRKTCEEFQAYEAERLERGNRRRTVEGTAGSWERNKRNAKYRQKAFLGRL